MVKLKKAKAGKVQGFFKLVEVRIRHLYEQDKGKTAENYACALSQFKQFRKGQDIPAGELSVNLMKDFQSYLIGKELKMNTVSLYMRMLSATYNYALDEDIILEDKRPFRKVFTGQEKTRKRAVKKNVVKQLIQADLSTDQSLEFSRDMFLFSIYTQGMAFVDIAYLTKDRIRYGGIACQRHKTNRRLNIILHPCAQDIINKWSVKDPDCPYLFPILYNPKKKKYGKYCSALRMHNKRLACISDLLKIDKPLSSYIARHTWASLAKSNGIKVPVISEAMGHTNTETTAIYLASLDLSVIASANKKVIASLMK
ncbi:site-specific integrase [Bacteroides gallinarum]|nr:site-specific integrase [Bacteroides gallinarum]